MVPDLAIPYLAELSYLAIPLVMFLGSSGLIPLPEEVILLIIGYAAFTDVLNLWLAMMVSVASVVVSDSIHFYCATHGHGILKWLLKARTLGRVKRSVNRHAFWSVFIARFVPLMRILTPWVAGTSGMKFKKFVIANFLGALIQTPLMIWIGFKLGPHIEKGIVFMESVENVIPWVLLVLVSVGGAYVYIRWKKKHQAKHGTV